MSLADFIAMHAPALERDEVRHNLILAIMHRAADGNHPLMTWTLGRPGACAIKSPGRAIIMGEVTPDECRALADQTRDLAYEGIIGLDDTADLFVERAREFRITFSEPLRQRIHVLRSEPEFPSVPGAAREVGPGDAHRLADWLQAFEREAVPDDLPAPRDTLERAAGENRHMFWTVDGAPVAVAGIVRRLRTAAGIAPVYTPPDLRGRGYAAAVTAALAARLLAEGRTAVCLYTKLSNVAANRCYAKIGFKRVCESTMYYQR